MRSIGNPLLAPLVCDNQANNLSWGTSNIHPQKKVLFAAPERERFEQKTRRRR
jgi:hypothetical protein